MKTSIIVIIFLAWFGFLVRQVIVLWRMNPPGNVWMTVALGAIPVLAAVNVVLSVVEARPYPTVERQQVGKLVAMQLGGGTRARILVEPETTFYTIADGFTARKGEPLELRVTEQPLFGWTRRYLCSDSGCGRLADDRGTPRRLTLPITTTTLHAPVFARAVSLVPGALLALL